MCKMLLSLESGHELEILQKEVAQVCEAMLAFPLRLPGTRFYKGLKVTNVPIKTHKSDKNGLLSKLAI
jgi:hypothetical protein